MAPKGEITMASQREQVLECLLAYSKAGRTCTIWDIMTVTGIPKDRARQMLHRIKEKHNLEITGRGVDAIYEYIGPKTERVLKRTYFGGNIILKAVHHLLNQHNNKWEGTANELLEEIKVGLQTADIKKLPTAPGHLSRALTENAPILNDKGITIAKKHSGNRTITIERSFDAVLTQCEIPELVNKAWHLMNALGAISIDDICRTFTVNRPEAERIIQLLILENRGTLKNITITI